MRLAHIPWTEGNPPAEAELRRRLVADGFAPMTWSDPPHRTYAPHSHDHDESLWCLAGTIIFHITGHDHQLEPGDRLMLPRGTVHGATAGRDGATYLIGERD